MSGGSFNCAYGRVAEFAEELDDRLTNADKVDNWGQQPNLFEPATLAKLREIQLAATQLSKLMRVVEYLYGGDIGEELFHSRIAEIEVVEIGAEQKPSAA